MEGRPNSWESFCAFLGDGEQKVGMGWDGWMVIIRQQSSKSTFGANNNSYCRKTKQKGKHHTREVF